MLTHPLLQRRSRANDAVHEDSGVTDRQLGCTCGFWISNSWLGAGTRGGLEDHRGAEGYKYAYHFYAGITVPISYQQTRPGGNVAIAPHKCRTYPGTPEASGCTFYQ